MVMINLVLGFEQIDNWQINPVSQNDRALFLKGIVSFVEDHKKGDPKFSLG